MWTPQFIGISVGFFLIIVAIMGGGVEVKEIKIPRLSGWARFGSAVLGAGIALASSGYNSGEPAAHAATAAQSQAIAATNAAAVEAPEADDAAEAPEEEPEPPAEPAAEPEPALPPPAPAAFVTITDKLGEGQEYERVVVYINGALAGRLAIDQSERMDRLRIPADNTIVRYHLEGTERGFQTAGMATHRLEGEGTIALRPGAVFEVSSAEDQADPNDDILQVDLYPAIPGAADGEGD